jgi:hypothetical protein
MDSGHYIYGFVYNLFRTLYLGIAPLFLPLQSATGQAYEVEKDRPVADCRGKKKGAIPELFEAVLLRRIKADLRFPKAGSRPDPRLKSLRQLRPSIVQPSTTILKAYKYFIIIMRVLAGEGTFCCNHGSRGISSAFRGTTHWK